MIFCGKIRLNSWHNIIIEISKQKKLKQSATLPTPRSKPTIGNPLLLRVDEGTKDCKRCVKGPRYKHGHDVTCPLSVKYIGGGVKGSGTDNGKGKGKGNNIKKTQEAEKKTQEDEKEQEAENRALKKEKAEKEKKEQAAKKQQDIGVESEGTSSGWTGEL